MKNVIPLRYISVLILVFSFACSSQSPSPTASPPASQPSAEASLAATAIPATDTSTPTPPSATQAVPLFTQSDGNYQVNLTPADFVQGIDNPYFPLPPGAKWVFEIRQGGVARQTDTLEVMRETRAVNGVQATVVHDTVSSGNRLVEDTYDWFAQDKYGNVWYVGESVDNYSSGVLAGHAGSWEWGVDGALPGIIMWADPGAHLGEEYRQEYYVGRAEDMGKVLSANESLTVPFGSFDSVVKTLDFSKIEAAQEQKFYAPGVGLIKELDVNGPEEVVLVSFTSPTK